MRRKHHPRKDEVDSIAQRLRSERPEASPLELDRAKTTAMSRARSLGGRRGSRRQFAVAALTIGLMAAGTGGVIAGGTTSSNPTNAATAQYGLGQGDGGGVLGNKHHKPPMSHRYIRIHLNVPRTGQSEGDRPGQRQGPVRAEEQERLLEHRPRLPALQQRGYDDHRHRGRARRHDHQGNAPVPPVPGDRVEPQALSRSSISTRQGLRGSAARRP